MSGRPRDFRIVLENSDSQVNYSGSTLTGRLLVHVNEPQNCKKITILFFGKADVLWVRKNDNANFRNSETYGLHELTIWSSEQSANGQLSPGEHSFPFQFTIPQSVPSSFEGPLGHIRYSVLAQIWTDTLAFGLTMAFPTHKVEVRVRVQQLVSITNPCLLEPHNQVVQKRVGYNLALVAMTISLPQPVFYIGEALPLKVSIQNNSKRQITLRASLSQEVTYTGKHEFFNHLLDRTDFTAIQYNKNTLLSLDGGRVAPSTTYEWTPTIQLPEPILMNERSCPFIHAKYTLKVKAGIPWSLSNLKVTVPVTLGSRLERMTADQDLPLQPVTYSQPAFNPTNFPPTGAAWWTPQLMMPSAPVPPGVRTSPQPMPGHGPGVLRNVPPPSYNEAVADPYSYNEAVAGPYSYNEAVAEPNSDKKTLW